MKMLAGYSSLIRYVRRNVYTRAYFLEISTCEQHTDSLTLLTCSRLMLLIFICGPVEKSIGYSWDGFPSENESSALTPLLAVDKYAVGPLILPPCFPHDIRLLQLIGSSLSTALVISAAFRQSFLISISVLLRSILISNLIVFPIRSIFHLSTVNLSSSQPTFLSSLPFLTFDCVWSKLFLQFFDLCSTLDFSAFPTFLFHSLIKPPIICSVRSLFHLVCHLDLFNINSI